MDKDILDSLHDSVAKELLARVRSGEATSAELSVATKFLKDNSISIDSGEIDELSSMERRLASKQANRPSLVSITNLPVAENG